MKKVFRSERFFTVQQDCDRTVVDQGNLHFCAEPSGFHMDAVPSPRGDRPLIQFIGRFRPCSRKVRRAPASPGIAVECKLGNGYVQVNYFLAKREERPT